MDKKILIIYPYNVFPVQGGGKKDVSGHLHLFKKLGYEVHLAQYVDNYSSAAEVQKLEQENQVVIHEILNSSKYRKSIYTNWYQARKSSGTESIEQLKQLIAKLQPDVYWFEYARFSKIVKDLDLPKDKVFFRAVNFELMHDLEKNGFHLKNFISIFLNEWLMFRVSNKVFCISTNDIRGFGRWYFARNMVYLPPFLDEVNHRHQVKDREVLNVLYMGSNYDNNVNYAGAEYLLKQVIPVSNKMSSGKFNFHFIGKGSDVLKELSEQFDNVKLWDFIPDLEEFIADMDISCIPVNIGRGTKIKMYESLSIGMPTIGFEHTFLGIPSCSNCYIVAENPEEYAKGLARLIDKSVRNTISQNAYNHIHKIGSEEALLNQIKKNIK